LLEATLESSDGKYWELDVHQDIQCYNKDYFDKIALDFKPLEQTMMVMVVPIAIFSRLSINCSIAALILHRVAGMNGRYTRIGTLWYREASNHHSTCTLEFECDYCQTFNFLQTQGHEGSADNGGEYQRKIVDKQGQTMYHITIE
jgi:hypothetical protein